ncbi:MAG TPA: hypothetical protein PKK61_08470, partial [Defluviitaleaceae bacterium]|nr:hypothetical protein [Defluviitaleaceae bacterium]
IFGSVVFFMSHFMGALYLTQTVNVPKMIINNICGKVNKRERGNYDEGIYMMKYNEIKVI